MDTGSAGGGGYAGGSGINVGAENAGDSGTSMRQQMRQLELLVVMERVWILLLEKQDIVQNHTKDALRLSDLWVSPIPSLLFSKVSR